MPPSQLVIVFGARACPWLFRGTPGAGANHVKRANHAQCIEKHLLQLASFLAEAFSTR